MILFRMRTKEDDIVDEAQRLKDAIAKTITEKMKAKGLNQTKLAKLIGIEKSYLSRILNGKTNVSLETMYRIAQALGFKWTLALSEKHDKSKYSNLWATALSKQGKAAWTKLDDDVLNLAA